MPNVTTNYLFLGIVSHFKLLNRPVEMFAQNLRLFYILTNSFLVPVDARICYFVTLLNFCGMVSGYFLPRLSGFMLGFMSGSKWINSAARMVSSY